MSKTSNIVNVFIKMQFLFDFLSFKNMIGLRQSTKKKGIFEMLGVVDENRIEVTISILVSIISIRWVLNATYGWNECFATENVRRSWKNLHIQSELDFSRDMWRDAVILGTILLMQHWTQRKQIYVLKNFNPYPCQY